MEDLSIKELESLLAEKRMEELRNKKKNKTEKKRKRMKFGKRALVIAFTICIILILFTMIMIYLGKDTTSLTILATAGVGILPIMYEIYNRYSNKISLKHMEKNYNPNYDEERGIY